MALKTRDAAQGGGSTAAGGGSTHPPPERPRRSGTRWLWGLPVVVVAVAVLAPRWWRLVAHPIIVPATPAAAAREELPRLLARVRAEPRSVDARTELLA